MVIGSSVAAAVVAMALAVVIFIFVRRQWSHSEERKLRIRAQLSGLAHYDDEVYDIVCRLFAHNTQCCLNKKLYHTVTTLSRLVI